MHSVQGLCVKMICDNMLKNEIQGLKFIPTDNIFYLFILIKINAFSRRLSSIASSAQYRFSLGRATHQLPTNCMLCYMMVTCKSK